MFLASGTTEEVGDAEADDDDDDEVDDVEIVERVELGENGGDESPANCKQKCIDIYI